MMTNTKDFDGHKMTLLKKTDQDAEPNELAKSVG